MALGLPPPPLGRHEATEMPPSCLLALGRHTFRATVALALAAPLQSGVAKVCVVAAVALVQVARR